MTLVAECTVQTPGRHLTIVKHTWLHRITSPSCDAGPLALSFACFANFAASNASVAPTLELPPAACLTAARARQRRVSTSGLLAQYHGWRWMNGCGMLCRVKVGNCTRPDGKANVQQFGLVQYIVALYASHCLMLN